MKRPLADFPVFPHCAEDLVIELTIQALNAGHLVKDRIDAALLAAMLREFSKCVGRLDDVLELQALSDDLGNRHFLVCDSVDHGGGLGAHWDEVPLLSSGSDDPIPLAAISGSDTHKAAHLSRIDLLLHEITHWEFQEHDLWFAALLNWQRLRCGLSLLSDPYDVHEESDFRTNETAQGLDIVLELAHELATAFSKIRRRENVVGALITLHAESMSWGGDAQILRRRMLELKSMAQQSCEML
ncbi:hypothetical protein [Metallibacterium scheffleri]|uniref:hypothetical protein n=1 Tax=Metallibacterium scheffleri TaxID=993689 RepID=UPI0009BF0B0E|nr:hypothetical protein [Metallibacterium scheffleri]